MHEIYCVRKLGGFACTWLDKLVVCRVKHWALADALGEPTVLIWHWMTKIIKSAILLYFLVVPRACKRHESWRLTNLLTL